MAKKKKVVLDPGHDEWTPGKRSPDGKLREYEANQVICNLAKEMIEKKYGEQVEVYLTKAMNEAKTLSDRVKFANNLKANVFLSIHLNAHGSGSEWTTASGNETYHFPNSNIGMKLAQIAHKHSIKIIGNKDRGVKSANFQVLRETNMPSILYEFLFMTNREECALGLTKDFRQKAATVVLNTVVEFLELEEPKVVVLNPKPDESVVVAIENGTPIIGKSIISASHMDAFIKSINPNALPVANYYYEIGEKFGIRGDIAFCQAIFMTAWFKFGGLVEPYQNNFYGSNANGLEKPTTFLSPLDGVIAHMQHLWAFENKKSLPEEFKKLSDPTFKQVARGTAKTWEELGAKWAVPGYDSKKYKSFQEAYKAGQTYGQRILQIYKQMENFVPPKNTDIKEPEDASDEVELTKFSKDEKVLHTVTRVDGSTPLPSVVIDGKGYIGASDIAKLFGKKVLWDKEKQEIVLKN